MQIMCYSCVGWCCIVPLPLVPGLGLRSCSALLLPLRYISWVWTWFALVCCFGPALALPLLALDLDCAPVLLRPCPCSLNEDVMEMGCYNCAGCMANMRCLLICLLYLLLFRVSPLRFIVLQSYEICDPDVVLHPARLCVMKMGCYIVSAPCAKRTLRSR